MTSPVKTITGGCLCGAIRYEARAEPIYAGFCYCADCRKASGAGSIPFMGFAAADLTIGGQTLLYTSRSFRGGDSDRNSCPKCGSLVFGGIVGRDAQHTIYAGSLDDPSRFKPQMAIFNRDRPAWVAAPPSGLTVFETMPE